MKSEPRYRKQVNKNGWMVGLQRLCFGENTPKFSGYCPFFWFTWLCLLIFPIALFVRLVGFVFRGIFSIAGRFESTKINRPKDSQLIDFYEYYVQYDRDLNKIKSRDYLVDFFEDVLEWIEVTPDWENCVKQAIIDRDKERARNVQRQARSDARAVFLRRMANYAGYVVKPILAVAGIVVTYYFVLAVKFLISHVTLPELVLVGKLSGFALAVVAVMMGIVRVIKAIIAHNRKCPKIPGKRGLLRKIGDAIESGICAAGDFLIDTIETIYTRECPLIEWGEESEPIQRRKGI